MKISGKLLAIMGGVTCVVVVSLVVYLVVIPKIKKRNKFLEFYKINFETDEVDEDTVKKAYNRTIKYLSDPGGWDDPELNNKIQKLNRGLLRFVSPAASIFTEEQGVFFAACSSVKIE